MPKDISDIDAPTVNAYDKRLANQYAIAMAQAKECYERADIAAEKLHRRNEVGTVLPLKDGNTLELVDNFANGNVSWKPAGVRRFDIKINKPRKSRSKKSEPAG